MRLGSLVGFCLFWTHRECSECQSWISPPAVRAHSCRLQSFNQRHQADGTSHGTPSASIPLPRGRGEAPRNTAAPHIPQPSPPHTAFTADYPSAPQHHNSFCQHFFTPTHEAFWVSTPSPDPAHERDHGNGRGDKLEDRRGLGGLPGSQGGPGSAVCSSLRRRSF